MRVPHAQDRLTAMAADNAPIASDLILRNVNTAGKEIGRGAYGRVYEVDYHGMVCAAKEVHTTLLDAPHNDKVKSDFLRECKIWSTIRHPCVVQFLGMGLQCLSHVVITKRFSQEYSILRQINCTGCL